MQAEITEVRLRELMDSLDACDTEIENLLKRRMEIQNEMDRVQEDLRTLCETASKRVRSEPPSHEQALANQPKPLPTPVNNPAYR